MGQAYSRHFPYIVPEATQQPYEVVPIFFLPFCKYRGSKMLDSLPKIMKFINACAGTQTRTVWHLKPILRLSRLAEVKGFNKIVDI